MNAAFVGKRTLADVGQILAMRQVGQFADVAGNFRKMLEVLLANRAHSQFQFEIGNHRAQVGIPAPFPIAVHRSLHLHGAQLHGGNRIGHRHVAIVVGVNSQGRFDLFGRA